MPRLYHSSWFDHPNNIWWGVQFTKFSNMWSPLPCPPVTSSHVAPDILLSTLFSLESQWFADYFL
jgi:hypothetical protein